MLFMTFTIGLILLVIQAAVKGNLAPETAGLIVLLATVLLALGKTALARGGILLLTVYFFSREFGLAAPGDFARLSASLVPLLIMLWGIYRIFGSMAKKK